ncbi:MAG: hypothetical protein M1833_002973 [Piccolia ochrophora]|nr:MAG: hypothetical protein M1833_002973 [Piccolia ochrophora]
MKSTDPVLIRLLTHNIRYATEAPFKGEETWTVRRPRLINELQFHSRHCPESFICLQEVLHVQLIDILHGLNRTTGSEADVTSTASEWTHIGVGRDDGKKAGEYSPILYRPSVWKLEHFKTVWLSETPSVPSKGWDAASVRILTAAKFQHRASRKTLVAFNTHLDEQGPRSRQEAARIILKEGGEWCSQGAGKMPLPIFLAGDLNSESNQAAYQTLNDSNSIIQDLRDMVPTERRYGNEDSATGFGDEERSTRIDFLFLGPRSGSSKEVDQHASPQEPLWETQMHSILANRFQDGVYISDHRAVVGDVKLI